ncbi:MAG: NAD(+)/NADH kinase [Candidatus Woesearchaeota archaeon]
MAIKNAIISYNKVVCPTTKEVARVLKVNDINFRILDREFIREKDTEGIDLVITIGGDGTFLTISHYVSGNTKILAVNASPRTTVGFYTRANRNNFKTKFKNILDGNFKTRDFIRIRSEVNGRQMIHNATNEVYFGHNRPHGTARYILKIENKKEFQVSSGLIVATPQGSYGWASSTGIKPLNLNSKKLVFVIREPISNNLFNPKIRKGTINLNQKVKILCKRGNAMIGIDGFGEEEMNVEDGDIVTIHAAKERLKFIDKC